jgi:hypothetical protein
MCCRFTVIFVSLHTTQRVTSLAGDTMRASPGPIGFRVGVRPATKRRHSAAEWTNDRSLTATVFQRTSPCRGCAADAKAAVT